MARPIKLTGREFGVVRAIGFGLGIKGDELCERLQMAPEDLVDVLNTLLDAGFVETASMRENVTSDDYATEDFEVNPSYAGDLKEAMRRA
jgi:hypothetical protein